MSDKKHTPQNSRQFGETVVDVSEASNIMHVSHSTVYRIVKKPTFIGHWKAPSQASKRNKLWLAKDDVKEMGTRRKIFRDIYASQDYKDQRKREIAEKRRRKK